MEEKEPLAAEAGLDGAQDKANGTSVLPTVNPAVDSQPQQPAESMSDRIHPAVYVVTWMTLSSSIIIFNKWILDTLGFHFPITLTCWHLTFATVMTQIMSRTTTMLDGRKKIKMTGHVYLRAIVPIGAAFSLSLIFGNLTYLYLSVAFIQMLKATTPVAVLLAGWGLGTQKPDLKVLMNVSVIVVGVAIASFGEIQFVLLGVLFQIGGIVFEALRLVLVERLLSGAEFKMDPLVSLYYFAPVCAAMNFCIAVVLELPNISMADVNNVGLFNFLTNACLSFALNMSVVFLIGKTSGLVMTLCGVLKDIILVGASVMIWATPISALQMFGYSIALCGLVYYKLGLAVIKSQASDLQRKWGEYSAGHPVARKVIVGVGALAVLLLVTYAAAPSVGYDTVASTGSLLQGTGRTAGNGRGGVVAANGARAAAARQGS